MLFHNPVFLFLFLPIVFTLYFYTSKYSKFTYEYVLIIAGIFFYAWFNIYLSPLIIISIIFNFIFGNLIRNSTQIIFKKKILFISIFFNILDIPWHLPNIEKQTELLTKHFLKKADSLTGKI